MRSILNSAVVSLLQKCIDFRDFSFSSPISLTRREIIIRMSLSRSASTDSPGRRFAGITDRSKEDYNKYRIFEPAPLRELEPQWLRIVKRYPMLGGRR